MCARGARPAWVPGPSTSPLERMRKIFALPYFSERTRLLLAFGLVLITGLGMAGLRILGRGGLMGILFLYAVFLALLEGRTGWRSASVSYNEHPVAYFVFLFIFVAFGVAFLVI